MGCLMYLASLGNHTISQGLASFNGLYTTQWYYLLDASTATIVWVLILFLDALLHSGCCSLRHLRVIALNGLGLGIPRAPNCNI